MNPIMKKVVDYLTIASFIGIPLVQGHKVITEDFSDKARVAKIRKAKNTDDLGRGFDKRSSDELLEELVKEGYQPAIDYKWKFIYLTLWR